MPDREQSPPPLSTPHATDEGSRSAAYARRLRRLGLRATPQRLLVLAALDALSGHVTAERIYQWCAARSGTINLATVYRTLDLLVSVELLTQTDLGDSAQAFEVVAEQGPHHHLVCETCRGVIELDDDSLQPLREHLLATYGFTAHLCHIALFGVCAHCRATKAAN